MRGLGVARPSSRTGVAWLTAAGTGSRSGSTTGGVGRTGSGATAGETGAAGTVGGLHGRSRGGLDELHRGDRRGGRR